MKGRCTCTTTRGGYHFAAIDFVNDTILYSQALSDYPVAGNLAMTSDGQRVFANYPRESDIGWRPPPPSEFLAYEPANLTSWFRPVDSLNIEYIPSVVTLNSLVIGEVAVTPGRPLAYRRGCALPCSAVV